ncbi:thiolase-like protein [Phlyctochytrium arcticum]|nr:thiolase-like protein [Phlyctochytrium arcticum]
MAASSKPEKRKVFIVGVGMTQFLRPGSHSRDYPDLAREAVVKALLDAGTTFSAVEQAFVGYCYGDSTCGQRALYEVGLTQIPIVNVNNNCSTGSTALWLARQAVAYGAVNCTLAVGFEKMSKGALSATYQDRASPLEPCVSTVVEKHGIDAKIPAMPQVFGNAGIEYCEKYGATLKHLAEIARKNHAHSTLNPYAQFRTEYTLEQIEASPKIYGPLTKLQCCPTSDGAAAVIVASEDFIRKHHLQGQAVEIVAQAMTTDSLAVTTHGAMGAAGMEMTREAAKQAFQEAGISPQDVQVVELHDCFSANELISYDALGLSPPGKAHNLLDDDNVSLFSSNGRPKFVVNPSGGLISKGHPLGATGLAQATELSWQLRGLCGKRQVSNVRYCLQHNIGLGGAAVVSIYSKRPVDNATTTDDEALASVVQKFGYNPAVECRTITDDQLQRVRFSKYFASKL